MIGWDGRLLADRLEEATIAAGLNPTWYCGASLVGEFGTYIGAAVTGPAAIRSATRAVNRFLERFADDAAQAARTGSCEPAASRGLSQELEP